MIYDIKKSLEMSQQAAELDFQDFEGQNLLIFAYFWQIFSPADQFKHLNRLEHTLANQFPSYVTLESH